ncbi:MAG: hypothetical protein M1825_001941 [Sarcosagium campestre]|nr:MAG: hypothetical protein M1825_001941 [Sarcosagium campestre]
MDREVSESCPTSPTTPPHESNLPPASVSGADPTIHSSPTPAADDNLDPEPASNPIPSVAPARSNSPDSSDRIFPIRSVVSVNPNQTPTARTEGSEFPDLAPRNHSRPSSQSGDLITSVRPSIQSRTRTEIGSRHRQVGRSDAAEHLASSSKDKGRVSSLGPNQSNVSQDNPRTYHARDMFSDGRASTPDSTTERGLAGDDRRGTSLSEVDSKDDSGTIYSARFEHKWTPEGHVVITGREGDPIQRCEDEPIHTPGAVQGFGALVALREDSEGRFLVRIVSENSKRIIGYSPSALFALGNFCEILSEEQADNLLDHIDFVREDEGNPASSDPEVFMMTVRGPPHERSLKLWCAIHINRQNPDLLICEFELDDDQIHPLIPAGDMTPEPAEDTLRSEPTDAEFAESTVNMSKPLRKLRSARKRKGEAAAMEVFNTMAQVQEQLASAESLDHFLKVLVGVVKELTGFHRVMVYQFDKSWNGQVITELVDPRATKDLYKGLHFPASDIPRQARDLYKINKVRLLYDRDLETARLVCREIEDLETPLDLTYSYLRAMSPIHIKYLANMAVRASMSISISAFDELWGLVSCHSYGSKGMRVSFPIRKMCRLIGDTACRAIERLSYASRLQARKLINTAATDQNATGYIVASSGDLLQLFDADFGVLSIRDETRIMGSPERSQEALAITEYLRMRRITSVLSCQDLTLEFPDLQYKPGFQEVAGLLLVPLSVNGEDFIVLLRRGELKEVKWAGNPYEKYIKDGTDGHLEPRKSFRTWSETVVGRCKEWTDDQIDTAAALCLVYGKFIEVWRQKEDAVQNSRLTRLLLANSAHEVRTPLNAIINYLEIALEGSIDAETRENLSRSHSASKSLIYVINDLLDLTKTEKGLELVKDEEFDLVATVKAALEMFETDALRKKISFEVAVGEDFPSTLIGDQRRLRQVVSSLAANAVQHTTIGGIKVDLSVIAEVDEQAEFQIVIEDTGCGMSSRKVEGLFRDLEQVHNEDTFVSGAPWKDRPKQLTPDSDRRQSDVSLGLGLSIVARTIRAMNGQLRLQSKEGKGSRFVVTLNFLRPRADQTGQHSPVLRQRSGIEEESSPSSPSRADGEVLLVPRLRSARVSVTSPSIRSHQSQESINSFKSTKSRTSLRSAQSSKSEVDRLIDAVQDPAGGPKIARNERATHSTSRSMHGDQLSSIMSSPRRPVMSRSYSHGNPMHHHQSPSRPGRDRDGPTNFGPHSGTGQAADTKINEAASSSTFQLSEITPEDSPVTRRRSATLTELEQLNILVAEDDPINSRIVKKRLEKSGHIVSLTVNGEECSACYGERWADFDVILMDMQMPIVDGMAATKIIRSKEKSDSNADLSRRAATNGRIPIFAVSASLEERHRQLYIDAGFDGWILKPIDFARVSVLFSGIFDQSARSDCTYRAGHDWERGGWFS